MAGATAAPTGVGSKGPYAQVAFSYGAEEDAGGTAGAGQDAEEEEDEDDDDEEDEDDEIEQDVEEYAELVLTGQAALDAAAAEYGVEGFEVLVEEDRRVREEERRQRAANDDRFRVGPFICTAFCTVGECIRGGSITESDSVDSSMVFSVNPIAAYATTVSCF